MLRENKTEVIMAIARRQSPAMARLRDELSRRKADLRFYRQRAKSATPVIMDAAITTAGGAAAGFVSTSPNLAQIAGIDTPLILGAGLVGYGVLSASKTGDRGYNSKVAEYACSLGKGMLAVYAGQMVAEFQIKKQLASAQEG